MKCAPNHDDNGRAARLASSPTTRASRSALPPGRSRHPSSASAATSTPASKASYRKAARPAWGAPYSPPLPLGAGCIGTANCETRPARRAMSRAFRRPGQPRRGVGPVSEPMSARKHSPRNATRSGRNTPSQGHRFVRRAACRRWRLASGSCFTLASRLPVDRLSASCGSS
jgi:hypothetical protein